MSMRKDINIFWWSDNESAARSRPETRKRLKAGREYDEDFDSVPGTARYSRVANGWNQKDLNENLRPLHRFLRKSVGRSWNRYTGTPM